MGGPPQQPDMPPGGVMMQMLMGRWLAQTISAVAKLGVADHVGDHPTPVADLARAVGANEDALYRALRALAMVGVVAEAAPRAFVLTPIGKTLRSDAHDSLRDVAIFFGHETHNRAWTALAEHFKRPLPLQVDPAGIFLFGNDGGQARAMLLDHDAGTIFWEEAFRDPEDLSWYIVDVMPWLLPQHVRYVGQECASLMRAIRDGECYVQG